MEKLNKRVSIIFAVLVAVFIGLAVGGCPIEPLNHQEYVIFEAGNDFMADFSTTLYLNHHEHALCLYHQVDLAFLAACSCPLEERRGRQHKRLFKPEHWK